MEKQENIPMQEFTDERLAALLKQGSAPLETGDSRDPWFTRRVLNRLPERQRSRSPFAIACYILAIAGCVVSWIWLSTTVGLDVITVRDCLYFTVIAVVTGVTVLAPFSALFDRN